MEGRDGPRISSINIFILRLYTSLQRGSLRTLGYVVFVLSILGGGRFYVETPWVKYGVRFPKLIWAPCAVCTAVLIG